MKIYAQPMGWVILMPVILVISVIACSNNDTSKETTATEQSKTTEPAPVPLVFDKLVGLWKGERGNSFEQWSKNDNGTYQSRAYSIRGKDTSWNEQASIYKESDKWVFENTVRGQNDGKAVKFTSTILNGNQVQFSNPAHDFPTDINYTVTNANTVNAFIIGPNNSGGKDTIPFNFTRVQ